MDWLFHTKNINKNELDPETMHNVDSFIEDRGPLTPILYQSANDRSSGYGHHSGYGGYPSGYSRYDGYAAPSGSGYGHESCCPPVIDPMTFLALLGRS